VNQCKCAIGVIHECKYRNIIYMFEYVNVKLEYKYNSYINIQYDDLYIND